MPTDLRVSFRRLGRRFVILSDPDDINHVINTHIDRYQPNILAQRLLEPLTGQGIVLLEGEELNRLHRRLVPVFQRAISSACFHPFTNSLKTRRVIVRRTGE